MSKLIELLENQLIPLQEEKQNILKFKHSFSHPLPRWCLFQK